MGHKPTESERVDEDIMKNVWILFWFFVWVISSLACTYFLLFPIFTHNYDLSTSQLYWFSVAIYMAIMSKRTMDTAMNKGQEN